MASIQELKEAIKKQFPHGIKTTLEKFQLAQLIAYSRTLKQIKTAENQISLMIRERHQELVKRVEKLLTADEINESRLRRAVVALTVLVSESKRLNLKVANEIKADVKGIGRTHRNRILAEYDDFGFNLDERRASKFFDKNGEYRKTLVIAETAVNKAAKNVSQDIEKGIQKTNKLLSEFALTGEKPRGLVGQVRDNLKTSEISARRVIRTEMIASANSAAIDTYEEFGTERISWSASFDSNVCPICTRLNGRIWDIDDPLRKIPPAHSNCVIGDTKIIAPGLRKAYKSFFEGPAVRIFFKGGYIAVTANHLFLTPKGFASASSLRNGDAIFSDLDSQGRSFIADDTNRKPSLAKDIFHSFAMSPEMLSVEMPSSAKDFYGDGTFIKGNINIVGADSFLGSKVCSEHRDIISHQDFVITDVEPNRFSGFGRFAFGMERYVSSLDSFMGGRCESEFFRLRELGHPDYIGLRSVSGCDAGFNKDSPNHSSGHAYSQGDGLLGFSRDIRFKNIINIEPFDFSGHVYTFETNSSLYISNGIISSNCRCSTVPIPSDDLLITERVRLGLNQQGEKLTGQKWLESKPESFVKEILGTKTKAEFFKKGLPLQAIVTSRGRVRTDAEIIKRYGNFSESQLKRFKKTSGFPKKAILSP